MNLENLYKMQEELDKYIIKNRNIAMSDEELLDKTILALLVEVGELANATRCFKHWSLKGMMDKEVSDGKRVYFLDSSYFPNKSSIAS